MKSKLIHESDGQRIFVAVLATGDDVMSNLDGLATRERLSAARLSAIGAFSDAVLAYFDWDTRQYQEIPIHEQVEVASLGGDIGCDEAGKPALHIHVVLGKRDGSAVAGHLLRAVVRPTLEVMITESPSYLRRRKDPDTGLNLIHV